MKTIFIGMMLLVIVATKSLDYETDQTLRYRYIKFYEGIDSIVRKYGDLTSPLCYSNGAAGTLNFTNIASLVQETVLHFVDGSAIDLKYLEKASNGFIFNVTGAVTIGTQYAQIMPAFKLYRMVNHIGALYVERIGENKFRIGGSVHSSSQGANLTCAVTVGCYPTSVEYFGQSDIYQYRYHEYVTKYSGNKDEYYLDSIITGVMSDYRSTPIRLFVPGGSIFP